MQKGTESSLRPIKDEKLRCKEEHQRMRITLSRTLESFLELFNSALDGHTLALLKVEGRASPRLSPIAYPRIST